MSSSTSQLVKPPALRPGDTIGVVAPASNINPADFEAGCEALRRAGYRVSFHDSILDRDLYFAGTLDRRVRELQEMFERDDIRAIVCARGGYGANYLLNRIDRDIVRAHPKIFVGYSDITSLLTWFLDQTGLAVFHGPMVAKDWYHADGVDRPSWQSSLTQTSPWSVNTSDASGLADGEAEGVLYGGCLSMLAASLGTPYELNTAGKILFIEDVAAKPFQIDRMLMQLKLGGHLKEVRGVVFGEMLDCRQSPSQDYTLQEVILRVVGGLGIPVAFGVRSGHVTSGNITFPFGVRARLTVNSAQAALEILESAVTA